MQIVNWRNFLTLAERCELIPDKLGMRGKEADGVTIAQQKCLRRFGIGYSGLKYKGQGSMVIKIAIERANARLATPGQLWALNKIGKRNLGKITFLEAAKILNENYESRV